MTPAEFARRSLIIADTPTRGPMPPHPPLHANPAPLSVDGLYYGRPHRLALRAGTYLALIRMMGVAHLVTALYGHAQLASHTFERLSRTRHTLRELIIHGLDSAPGRAAMSRLVQVHQGLPGNADDFAYVLSCFILEPLRWNAQWARQPLSPAELARFLGFWSRVGEGMGLNALPASLDDWRTFQSQYETAHLRRTDEGHRIAHRCLREVVRLSVPLGAQTLFRQLMLTTMEPAVRELLALPRPSPAWGLLVRLGLRFAR